jgi:hypothetical protein
MKSKQCGSAKVRSGESGGNANCCAIRPKLNERPLLSFVEAVKVMALFKILANDTRIRLLHHLIRSGESTVTDLSLFACRTRECWPSAAKETTSSIASRMVVSLHCWILLSA